MKLLTETDLLNEYENEISLIKSHITKNKQHFLLICPDNTLLLQIIEYIKQTLVPEIFRRRNKNRNKLIFFQITNEQPKKQQRMTYLYLDEKSNNIRIQNSDNCANDGRMQVILYSSRFDAIESMEKRVRSRFNNEIVYFPFLKFDTFVGLIAKYTNKTNLELITTDSIIGKVDCQDKSIIKDKKMQTKKKIKCKINKKNIRKKKIQKVVNSDEKRTF